MSDREAICAGCERPIYLVEVLPHVLVWRHRYRDEKGVLHVYRWCRIREAAPRKRPRPFLGECTVCGGAHYSEEHDAGTRGEGPAAVLQSNDSGPGDRANDQAGA